MYERLKRDLSFIQGMLEGDVNHHEHVEYKAVQRLLDVTDQLVEVSEQLDRRLSELEEYVEAVDEDLNDLELLVYDEEDLEEDAELVTVTCPDCGEGVLIDEEDFEDDTIELLCPKCNTVLEVKDINEDEVDEIILEEA